MRISRDQADIVVPGVLVTALVALAFFARPLLIPGGVLGALMVGIYYAARDASNHG